MLQISARRIDVSGTASANLADHQDGIPESGDGSG